MTILLLALLWSLVAGIPFTNLAHPKDTIRSNAKITFRDASMIKYDSDTACSHYYSLWWPKYAMKRLRALEDAMQNKVDSMKAPYTFHPDDAPPVESIRGHAYSSKGSRGTNKKPENIVPDSCDFDCSDTRTTFEMLFAIIVDGRDQVRAKSKFFFLCPVGYRSREYKKRSRRERAFNDDAAFKLLKHPRFQLGMRAAAGDLRGEDGDEVMGCHCEKMEEKSDEMETETSSKAAQEEAVTEGDNDSDEKEDDKPEPPNARVAQEEARCIESDEALFEDFGSAADLQLGLRSIVNSWDNPDQFFDSFIFTD